MTEEQKRKVSDLRRAGMGYTETARLAGVSRDAVRSFCRRNGLAGQAAQDGQEDAQAQEGICRECGKPLQQTAGVKRRAFCSRECREKWWHGHPEQIRQRAVYSFICAGCGKQFDVYGDSRRKYCSHGCYIKARFGGGEAAQMSEGEFRAEMRYRMSLAVARAMLEEGAITKEEYSEIDTILLQKHRPILGTLLAGKTLQ